jgi:hypothetical protein
MAQIKPLDERVQFNGSAQGGQFNPATIPNPNAGLNAKLATINESFDNMRTSGVDNINARYKNLQELGKFSDTLGKTLQQGMEFYAKNAEEQALLDFTNDVSAREAAVARQNEVDLKVSEIDQAHEDTAAVAIKQGAPVEIVEKLKGSNLGGLRGYYYRRNAAKYYGEKYEEWIQNQLLTNNTEIDINGVVKPVNDVTWGVPEHEYIRTKLKSQYLKETGLDQISQDLLAKYTLPALDKTDSKLMGIKRKAWGYQQSEQTRSDADADFGTTYNLGTYLKKIANTFDENGNAYGYAGAYKYVFGRIKEMFDVDMITDEQWNEVKKQVDPVTGKTFYESRPLYFKKLDEDRASENRKNFAEDEAEIELKFKQEEKAILEYFNTNQPSQADVEAAEKDLFRKYGKTSSALSTMKSTYTVDAEQEKSLNDQFENLASQGLLTPDMVVRAPFAVQQKWLSVAQKQQEASDKTGGFKNELKSIENTVKTNPGVKVSPDGSTSGMATLVIGELQSKFKRKVSEYVGAGVSSTQASQQALAETIQEFSSSPRYALNNYGEFANFKQSLFQGSVARSKFLNNKLNNIRQTLQATGKLGLESPELILNKNELLSLEKGYGEPGWSVPPVVQYWSGQLNVNPLEIINRQRKAVGMKELATPGSIDMVKGSISPGLQRLLNSYQSPNRSTRALSSMRRFDVRAIPGGYGPVVESSARANGIDPAILAGLLEVESGFIPNRVSSAGARGIAQIVPKYHPGVNPDDPIASIKYAARHIAETQRQFGGDMRLALLAYNGGTPTIAKYRGPIPGSRENQQYYGKVMKAAAKYGYGQAWNDPATMRGRFASSITFDSGQPGIDVYFEDKNFTTVLPGRVKEVGNQTTAGGNGYGNYVVVESIDPLTQRPVDVLYAHLDSINVKEGQSLKAGSRIGRQGGTGRVVSQDGTIASIDFLAPAPKGSKSMAPYSGYEQLRRYIAKNLRQG